MYPTTQTYNVANERGYYWGNPIGTLISFYGTVAPAHYLICDGSYIPRTFNSLISLIGDYLPDFRECAIVGIGQNWRDPSNGGMQNHDVFALGEFKDDCLQRITGSFNGAVGTSHETSPSGAFKKSQLGSDGTAEGYFFAQFNYSFDSSLIARSGSVTRGKRMGALICIRAE